MPTPTTYIHRAVTKRSHVSSSSTTIRHAAPAPTGRIRYSTVHVLYRRAGVPSWPTIMATAQAAGCTLHFLNETVHLIGFVFAGDLALSRHFLSHYEHLGIARSRMRIVADADASSMSQEPRLKREAAHLARIYAGCNLTFLTRPFKDQLKIAAINGHMRFLPFGSWVLVADADEFFSFPCDLPRRLAVHDNWCALMVDRLSSSGFVQPVRRTVEGSPASDLASQFPLSCHVRSHVRPSIRVTKTAITQVREICSRRSGCIRRVFADVHHAIGGGVWGCRPLPPVAGAGAIAHYTLTLEAVDFLRRKVRWPGTLQLDYGFLLNFTTAYTPSQLANQRSGMGSTRMARPSDLREHPWCQPGAGPSEQNWDAAHFRDGNWERYFPCDCKQLPKVCGYNYMAQDIRWVRAHCKAES